MNHDVKLRIIRFVTAYFLFFLTIRLAFIFPYEFASLAAIILCIVTLYDLKDKLNL
jgi:hypothetical protein